MGYCDFEDTNIRDETLSDTGSSESLAGTSPYATGGGGFTFERKVAVQYLAHLLLGDGAIEFGDGRIAVNVEFQQAPDFPVDDLVIRAARPEETQPSLELALGVRRSPNLVRSDARTQKLIREFVRAVINEPADGLESRLGLVVAGPQPHAQQLGSLAGLAAVQMDAAGFFDLVHTPKKFDKGIRDRLAHLESLVENALRDLGEANPDAALVRQRTWQLLSRLTILMPRLESPDETDWSEVENKLIPVARAISLSGAEKLRDRLLTLASDYSPRSARVDLTILRRDAHETLDTNYRRHQQGWQILDHLHGSAFQSLRDEVTDSDKIRRVSLDRSEVTARLIAVVGEADAVVVVGESGVGKSALTIRALSARDPDTMGGLCIDLRQMPRLTVEFEARLGLPLSTLLGELSAPLRMLVIDGADAVAEGMEDAFRYLVRSAEVSGVKVIAVSGIDGMQVVYDILTDRFGDGVAKFPVEPLTDIELDEIVETFPELKGFTSNPQSRELSRRLVVMDLLVRGQLAGVPLSDADAMLEVWSGLVRRHERLDRGHPDARQSVLLRLGDLSLNGGDKLGVIGQLDTTAITGLRQDGLLQASTDNPFVIGPDFAHDEIRRYSVARLLLLERNPAKSILRAEAPRWALGAARLACQALLQEPYEATSPLRGRLDALQTSFDALIQAGHGTRWGDVPSEALISLADPSEVLRDAWGELRSNDDAGLKRLVRLVEQRHRDSNGIVNLVVVEPIITLILEAGTPWRSGDFASNLLREWLIAHIVARTPTGHPLRILLRERLLEVYAEGDRWLREQESAEEAARAARTPEDIERERRFMESNRDLFEPTGYGGRQRRQRPKVPRECKDEVFLELLALLGPDLGKEGEEILLRVARDAPSFLAPVLEEFLTANALAGYRRGLLAHLTQAYYLDDEADGSSSMDDGIRRHHSRRGGLHMPISAWYRGPFAALFKTDFRGGVTVLNRMLNHAALVRARNLSRLYSSSPGLEDTVLSTYQISLEITGTPVSYIGDDQVWRWYRRTGVGPYPCISALQALEVTVDQFIKAGLPVRDLAPILLDGCENLAMVGLVVGVLERHLEVADELLDPYFTEPKIWSYEFTRVVSEQSMIAASSEGIEAPERRNWSLRDAAMLAAFMASDERADVLRGLGGALVDKARIRIEQHDDSATAEGASRGDEDLELQLAPVRAWASCLDRNSLQIIDTPNGTYIQATPSEEVVQALLHGKEESDRTAEEIRLTVRYYVKSKEANSEEIQPEELLADLESARMLLEKPPNFSAHHPWEVPALVAAVALEAYILRHIDLPGDELAFALHTVLRVSEISEDEASRTPLESEGTFFEQGADRSAARAVPLLLTPSAEPLRAIGASANRSDNFKRISNAGLRLARAVANEVRLHLARGFDHLWDTPCVHEGTCHHQTGIEIVKETLRDCALGEWGPELGSRSIVLLDEPISVSLANTSDDAIMVGRLDASIRALAPASAANICVSSSSRELLMVVLAAQRRCLLNYKDPSVDDRGDHSLVSARALLTLAEHSDDGPLLEHINAYCDSPILLSKMLQALSAAAEENEGRASTALRIWPSIIRRVMNMPNAGHSPLQGRNYDETPISVLLPNAAPQYAYLYREIQGMPIVWWEPLSLKAEVDMWIGSATGKARCADQLIGFLKPLSAEDQASVGIPWVSVVLGDLSETAKSSFLLTDWLIETRSAAAAVGLLGQWQQLVDALVVEGVARLARYSE